MATYESGLLAYYAVHSAITDPGRFANLLDVLPLDVAQVARAVQGLLMHPAAAPLYGEPPEQDRNAWGYRTMEETLERILALDGAPLSEPRPPAKRLRGNCRNFAVLFVSILRHRGIPARRRVGFARYLPGRHSYTHEIAEYWSAPEQRWVLVDPQVDQPTLAAQRSFFESIGEPTRAAYDPLDIRLEDQFVTGGAAWRLCRIGAADPDTFRSGPWMGLREIACAALQDLDGLSKAELLSTDSGHAPTKELTAEDVALLDRIADLAEQPDAHFDDLRALFTASAYGRRVASLLRHHRATAARPDEP